MGQSAVSSVEEVVRIVTTECEVSPDPRKCWVFPRGGGAGGPLCSGRRGGEARAGEIVKIRDTLFQNVH